MNARVVLLVDPDPEVAREVGDCFARENMEIISAQDGEVAIKKFCNESPDLLISEIVLHGYIDGFKVVSEARRIRKDIPVIILSSRGSEVDRILGLRVGADDYVCKPFNPLELALRAKAVLRRVCRKSAQADTASVMLGPLYIDRSERVVTVCGKDVPLTYKEFEFLWVLASNCGKVIPYHALLHILWHDDYAPDCENLKVLASRVKSKFRKIDPHLRLIHNVRNVGYKISSIRAQTSPKDVTNLKDVTKT